MKTKTSVLSALEMVVLRLLSNGAKYPQIKAKYPLMTQASFHSHCYNIRHKTGIRETRDPQECRRYIRTLGQTLLSQQQEAPVRVPTPRQMEVLRLVAQGKPYAEIARLLSIDRQSAQNTASNGARRAGIIHGGWQRTKLIRAWLANYDAEQAALRGPVDPMDDPMF